MERIQAIIGLVVLSLTMLLGLSLIILVTFELYNSWFYKFIIVLCTIIGVGLFISAIIFSDTEPIKNGIKNMIDIAKGE